MTWPSIDRAAHGLGRPLARCSAALAALGAFALVAGPIAGRGDAVLVALEASWLFLAGLAAGTVALAAAVRLSHGRWADEVLHVAEAGGRFFGPTIAVLALLLAGRGASDLRGGRPAGSLAIRVALLLVAGLLVAGLGARFVALGRARGEPPWRVRGAAATYLVAFGVGLSIWAWGLAPDLAAQPAFTVVPPLVFMGAFLSGVAGVALVAALQGLGGPDVRHDLGKLLFAFSAVWGYLLWSLVLPTWYGNIPAEAGVLLARWSGASRPFAVMALAGVLAVPLILLLPEPWKRRRAPLAAGATSVLVGLWTERFLLVVPPLERPPDAWSLLIGGGVAAGMAGLFLLSVGGGLAVGPRHPEPPGHPSS
jgi:hypothetical protein